LDWKVLKKNRDDYIKRLNVIYADIIKSNSMTYLKGYGKFVDDKTVECEGNLYTADHILIATGSVPVLKDIEGIEHAISSDGFFDLEE
jgi:glutathione reductase (NADPH)